MTPEISHFLERLRARVTVGVVGGSDLVKQKEQLGENIVNEADYSFSGSFYTSTFLFLSKYRISFI